MTDVARVGAALGNEKRYAILKAIFKGSPTMDFNRKRTRRGRLLMNEHQRQRKLEKRRRKDKQRHARIEATATFQRGVDDPVYVIKNSRKLPIYECWINSSWRASGMAQIIISRLQKDGNLVFGVYLVDLGCLGLKNTFCNVGFTKREYNDFVSRFASDWEIETCPAELAQEIIYGGIDYAARWGFKPQRDFELSRHVLDERSSLTGGHNIEFGRNGRPFYIAGPDDNPQWVLQRLAKTAGAGNFHFVTGLDSEDCSLDELEAEDPPPDHGGTL